MRYIPVPTGNSLKKLKKVIKKPVYPCTYRELWISQFSQIRLVGISLYLQGTLEPYTDQTKGIRYIPVPTGNSQISFNYLVVGTVYPCTYRELLPHPYNLDYMIGISLYLQGTLHSSYLRSPPIRYIPVPTGNSNSFS